MKDLCPAVDWDAYAHAYDTLSQLHPYQAMLQAIARAVPTDAQSVFDAGCGTGNVIAAIHNILPSATIVGLDLSETMLKLATGKFHGHDNIAIQSGDLSSALPFADESFDVVTCSNVLYTLPDPAATVREFCRILRPDGVLVLTTPKQGYENGLILKAHCGSTKPDSYWKAAHASTQREHDLITEAVGAGDLGDALSLIATYNRQIVCATDYTFFTATKLVQMVGATGLHVATHTMSYANQVHFVVAKKREMMT